MSVRDAGLSTRAVDLREDPMEGFVGKLQPAIERAAAADTAATA